VPPPPPRCIVAEQTTLKFEGGPPCGTAHGVEIPRALARLVPTCPAELSTKSSHRFPTWALSIPQVDRERETAAVTASLFSLCGKPACNRSASWWSDGNQARHWTISWVTTCQLTFLQTFLRICASRQAGSDIFPPPTSSSLEKIKAGNKIYQMLILIIKITVNVQGGELNHPVFDLLIKSWFQLQC
jgi:hypothetical protein